MEHTYDPLEAAAKRRVSPLQDAARECWALACWLTLRRTWAQWEQERAGDKDKRGATQALPPAVEAFFGRYAHTTYCQWIPSVVNETVTRKERDRKRRKENKEAATQFSKLIKTTESEDEEEEESTFVSTSLRVGEELFGVLASELDQTSGKKKSPAANKRQGAASLHIPDPSRPFDSKDRTPWEAWVATENVLWVPRKKGRVLMNELFKQPMRKPTETPSDMLRCLTGYLKTIVREAVRKAAQEAILLKDGSDGQTLGLDTPIQGPTHRGKPVTPENYVRGKEDTEMSVHERELREWSDKVAADEFYHAENTDGVRMNYYLETLKKSDGWNDGFVVSSYDPAILVCLRMGRATLNDRITKSRKRVEAAAKEHAALIGCRAAPLEEWLLLRIKEIAVPWFWSEKIPPTLFGTIMDIIHQHHDQAFACPFTNLCSGHAPHAAPASKCHECKRK